jgi:peptide methionine sulfoxide reductase MsrB
MITLVERRLHFSLDKTVKQRVGVHHDSNIGHLQHIVQDRPRLRVTRRFPILFCAVSIYFRKIVVQIVVLHAACMVDEN